jgi:hypothetical protein
MALSCWLSTTDTSWFQNVGDSWGNATTVAAAAAAAAATSFTTSSLHCDKGEELLHALAILHLQREKEDKRGGYQWSHSRSKIKVESWR